MNSEWIREIAIDDLPLSYQEIARIVGIEVAIKLSEHLGGLSFYFPKIESLLTKKKEDYIRRNFSGNNHKELALTTGYSAQWVYKILKNSKGAQPLDSP